MYKKYLGLILNENISINDSFNIASSMLNNELSELQIASLLTGIKFKGESYELITGFAKAMKEYSLNMIKPSKKLIDVCGTGGDGSNSFNISTAVGFVLAASGLTVAKHGNKSISSKSGSADLIKELGINFSKTKLEINDELNEFNFSFLHAPLMHPSMKYIMPIRLDLKIPTIFNIIGPLCNPYDLDYQVIGVYSSDLLLPMAKAVKSLGIKRAAIVHGHGFEDELTLSGINKVVYIIDNKITEDTIDPKLYGFPYSPATSLIGGNSEKNLSIMYDIFEGKHSPKFDVILLNAGLCLYIGEKVSSIDEGIKLAKKLIENKKVLSHLNNILGGNNEHSRKNYSL